MAEVTIIIARKAGASIPLKVYCTQPYKILNVTEDAREGILKLMLMSSSPGILDGDHHNIHIEVGTDCAFELQTQSYQRLFKMKTSAQQHLNVHLLKDASFKYLPHPVVPHESSNFVTTNKIFLAEGCRLIWGEVFTCGRKLNGEIFHFTRYQSVTEIFFNGRLMIKENLLMEPALIDANGMGQLEGFTHQATFILLDPVCAVKELMEMMADWLDQQKYIIYGITPALMNGIIIRILGNKAEQLFDCLKTVAEKFYVKHHV